MPYTLHRTDICFATFHVIHLVSIIILPPIFVMPENSTHFPYTLNKNKIKQEEKPTRSIAQDKRGLYL